MCRRPAAKRGRVHGYHLPGLHSDVCPQASRGGPGRGAGRGLCEPELSGIKRQSGRKVKPLSVCFLFFSLFAYLGNQRSEQHDSEYALSVFY